MPGWPSCPLEGAVSNTLSKTYRVSIADDHLHLKAGQLPRQGHLSAPHLVEVSSAPDHVGCIPWFLSDACRLGQKWSLFSTV